VLYRVATYVLSSYAKDTIEEMLALVWRDALFLAKLEQLYLAFFRGDVSVGRAADAVCKRYIKRVLRERWFHLLRAHRLFGAKSGGAQTKKSVAVALLVHRGLLMGVLKKKAGRRLATWLMLRVLKNVGVWVTLRMGMVAVVQRLPKKMIPWVGGMLVLKDAYDLSMARGASQIIVKELKTSKAKQVLMGELFP